VCKNVYGHMVWLTELFKISYQFLKFVKVSFFGVSSAVLYLL